MLHTKHIIIVRVNISAKIKFYYTHVYNSHSPENTHPKFLRRSRSLANLALRLRQHITMRANSGKPKIHDTMGMIIFSGVTETTQSACYLHIRLSRRRYFWVFPSRNLTRRVYDYGGELFVLMIDRRRQFAIALTRRHFFSSTAPRRVPTRIPETVCSTVKFNPCKKPRGVK